MHERDFFSRVEKFYLYFFQKFGKTMSVQILICFFLRVTIPTPMLWFYTGEVAFVGITRYVPVMGNARHHDGRRLGYS